MRWLLTFAAAPLALVASAQAASLEGENAPRPPLAADMRMAQLIPKTAPAEATTGNPSLPPLKWVGMLVIPTPSTSNANSILECTAQFIRPNVLLTAGHCIRDLPENPAGPWPDPTKGTFWLQYQNQEGTPFRILCAAVNPLWSFPPNYGAMSAAARADAQQTAFQHDYAMVLVDGVSPTGSMPYALDWKGKVDYVTRVGYAGDILDGQIVQKSGGPVFFADASPMFSKDYPDIVVQWAPVTGLTEGTSGGAWIANFNTIEGEGKNILIAVTSFSFTSYPGGEGAAYLVSAEFDPLLKFVSNGCK